MLPWKESYDQPREHIKKQRHCFVNKGPSSQFSSFSRSVMSDSLRPHEHTACQASLSITNQQKEILDRKPARIQKIPVTHQPTGTVIYRKLCTITVYRGKYWAGLR